MPDYSTLHKVDNRSCTICGSMKQNILGVRGNREYSGADVEAQPHVCTNIVQCKNCGFIYTNPLIEGADSLEKQHYSSEQTYTASTVDSVDEMFAKRVRIIHAIKQSGDVLDIGSGRGELLHVFSQWGYYVQGIEPSNGLCRYSVNEYNIDCFNGHVEDYKSEKKFDIITSIHSLEHIDDPNTFMRGVSRLIKQDGILMIEVPNTGSLLLRFADIYFRIKGLKWSSRLSPLHPPFHKYGYTKKSLKYLLHENGYRILQVITLDGADRGYNNKSVSNLEAVLRKLCSGFFNILGNREILVVIAALKQN